MKQASAWVTLACLAATLAAAAAHDIAWLATAFAAVAYPFQLDYGEGIVWWQATRIPGPDMYGDIARYPWTVFHYPPFYHLVLRGLAAAGFDWLCAGRALSLIASLASASLIACLATRLMRAGFTRLSKQAGAATAGAMFFCFDTTMSWTIFLRVDALALMFAVLGLCLATAKVGGTRWLYLGIAAFAAAVYTKQTYLAAALSTVAVLACTDTKRARNACLFGAMLAGPPLIALTAATEGGFLRHMTRYNINRFDVDEIFALLRMEPGLVGPTVLAAAGVAIWWFARPKSREPRGLAWLRMDRARVAGSILTLWLILTTASLTALGKSGAALNYLLEWIAALCVFSGLTATWLTHLSITAIRGPDADLGPDLGQNLGPDPKRGPALSIGAMLLAGLALYHVANTTVRRDPRVTDATMTAELQALRAQVAATPGLVLSDDMVLLMRSGKPVPWEPAIFQELAAMGLWDEQPLLAAIASQTFPMIVEFDPSVWSPGIRAAIAKTYAPTSRLGGRTVLRPR